ncbi:MAG: XRE family transcriptional regulator [Anaerolineales bacterium]|jgi:transcriptional regulator with XRE-family HTH domain
MFPKPDDRKSVHVRVGVKLKERRKQLGLTLDELAEKTGLTASFISQVERGKASLSLQSLQAMAEALDSPMLYFMTDGQGTKVSGISEHQAQMSNASYYQQSLYEPVVRPENRPRLVFPLSGIQLELLVPSLGQKMVSFKGRLEPGNIHMAKKLREPTEEILYMVSGTLTLEFTFGSYTLHPDESIYFEGKDLLRMICASEDEAAVWISVITPAVF